MRQVRPDAIRTTKPASSGGNLEWIVIFAGLLALSHFLDNLPLRVVGWTYLLPNHTYLYVFAWVPLAVYLAWHLFGQEWGRYRATFVAGIFGFSSLVYLLAGCAQLYRFWIIPFGLLTLVTSYVFLKTAILLFPPIRRGDWNLKTVAVLLVGPALIVLTSTIYLQPWALVISMPHVEGVSLRGLDLRGMDLNNISFSNSDLSGASFSGATLSGVTFRNAALNDVTFYKARIENTEFETTRLKSADFQEAWIYQVTVSDSDLSGADFRKSSIGRTFILDSKLCSTKFEKIRGRVYSWHGSVYDKKTRLPDFEDDTVSPKTMSSVERC